MINVTNRSAGTVVYRIPEENIRREFNPHETKKITEDEIEKACSQPGVRELFYNYLFIDDEHILHDVINLDEQPEYWLTEDMIPNWLNTCTLDQFQDAIDFAPLGVIDLIKKYAVSQPLNDFSKRDIMLKKLNFNVTNAIENIKDDEDNTTKDSATKRRSETSYKQPTTRIIIKEK